MQLSKQIVTKFLNETKVIQYPNSNNKIITKRHQNSYIFIQTQSISDEFETKLSIGIMKSNFLFPFRSLKKANF